MSAGEVVAAARSLLQPVQCDIQQQGRNDTALGSSLPGRREPFPSLEDTRLQPPGDHRFRGETAEHLQQVLIADPPEPSPHFTPNNPYPPTLPPQSPHQH